MLNWAQSSLVPPLKYHCFSTVPGGEEHSSVYVGVRYRQTHWNEPFLPFSTEAACPWAPCSTVPELHPLLPRDLVLVAMPPLGNKWNMPVVRAHGSASNKVKGRGHFGSQGVLGQHPGWAAGGLCLLRTTRGGTQAVVVIWKSQIFSPSCWCCFGSIWAGVWIEQQLMTGPAEALMWNFSEVVQLLGFLSPLKSL